jgi:LacI family transcriptional regulator
MNRKNTIQEVADGLGLSRVTVSLVLNGKAIQKNISEKTVARVNKYIHECGFVPSAAARKLRAGRSESIGILHSGQLYSHLVEAVNRFTSYFVDKDTQIEIMLAPHRLVAKGAYELISRGISKLIWIQTGPPEIEFAEGDSLINMLKCTNTIIYNYKSSCDKWNNLLENAGIKYVMVDRSAGFRDLAAFLKKTGHRNIALGWTKFLADKYHNAFEEAGLKIHWIEPCDQSLTAMQWALGIVKKYMVHPERKKIDGICTLDDMVACHVMTSLAERGVMVPDDVTVTGFDGMEFGMFSHVPLTTLEIPVKKMVEWTIKTLETQAVEYRKIFNPELILRSSHKNRLQLL